MEKTIVYAGFYIYGDEPNPELDKRLGIASSKPKQMDNRKLIDLDEITRQLDIQPTKTRSKGIKPERGLAIPVVTSWILSTNGEESYDVNEQLGKIISQLRDKINILNELRNNYNIRMEFIIAVYVRNNNVPAMHFDIDILKFITYLDASLDIDLYTYS